MPAMMYQNNFGFNPWGYLAFFWPLIILDLVLKGFALWRSAKNNHPWWFLAILLINTMGILPFIYLFAIDKKYVFKELQKRFSK